MKSALFLLMSAVFTPVILASPIRLSDAENDARLGKVNLALEVPENISSYQIVTSAFNPDDATVPVVTFDEFGYLHDAGSLPLNTPIQADNLRIFNRKHFYGFPAPGSGTRGSTIEIHWISGEYLKISGRLGGK